MDEKTRLLAIIRRVILGQTADVPEMQQEDCEKLLRLADMHDLGHIVSYWIEKNRKPTEDELLLKYQRSRRMAIFRETKQEYVKGLLFDTLTEAGVPFIPLKGIRIRALYPQGWMRTSGDLDVLVRDEDLSRALEALTARGFETDGKRKFHDVELAHSGVRVEIHFNVGEDMKQADRVLLRVWDDYAEPVSGMEYRESSAFFIFHHIAHMCYHFKTGGCGIRTFIDLYLMLRAGMQDGDELRDMLETGGLLTFYESACRLTRVWFDGEAHDPVTEAMEQYVLGGGVYGSVENRGAVVAGNRTGRLSFLLQRLFPSVSYMRSRYPVLTRSRVSILLLPFMYVYRVFETVFSRNRRKIGDIMNEYKGMKGIGQDKIDSTAWLMREVGLDGPDT